VLYRPKWDRLSEKQIEKVLKSAEKLKEKQAKQEQAKGETVAPPVGRVLKFVNGSDVKPERLTWLWRGRILADKLNAFSGEPGIGKGLTTIYLAARVTTHTDFPDCKNELDGAKDVLFLSSEDDIHSTIAPQLKVAGADMSRIHFAEMTRNVSETVEEDIVCLDQDLPVIEEMVKQHPDIALIVIDPVIAFLGNADANKDKDVRPIYSKMKTLAKRLGVSILCVHHWNKNANATSINRTSGAKTFVSAPRATWMFSQSPEDPELFLMMRGKGNLAAPAKTLSYRIIDTPFDFGDGQGLSKPGEGIGRLEWQGETEHTTEEVLQDANDSTKKQNGKAEKFLENLLAETELGMWASDAYAASEAKGIKPDTLKRARRKLDYSVGKVGDRWWWSVTAEDLAARRAQFYTPGAVPALGGTEAGGGPADVDLGPNESWGGARSGAGRKPAESPVEQDKPEPSTRATRKPRKPKGKPAEQDKPTVTPVEPATVPVETAEAAEQAWWDEMNKTDGAAA
jgi:hypothetical protein